VTLWCSGENLSGIPVRPAFTRLNDFSSGIWNASSGTPLTASDSPNTLVARARRRTNCHSSSCSFPRRFCRDASRSPFSNASSSASSAEERRDMSQGGIRRGAPFSQLSRA
jgi:hypothetical protein